MRQRTPSEIKAYGDGYAEAYKEFCHLLEKNDKDKAIRKMKILADAVALTVETATDEPTISKMEQVEDKPQTNCEACELDGKADVCKICRVSNYEPQTDCPWK